MKYGVAQEKKEMLAREEEEEEEEEGEEGEGEHGWYEVTLHLVYLSSIS